MDISDKQNYRLRDYAPSERVRTVAIDTRKKTPRYEMAEPGPFAVTRPRMSTGRAALQ